MTDLSLLFFSCWFEMCNGESRDQIYFLDSECA